jgi:hypothetical protein
MGIAAMKRVFVSYRRQDSGEVVAAMVRRLRALFDRDQVFMDLDLEGGMDFVEALEQELAACDAAILVIGPDWRGSRGPGGGWRIDDGGDFVRLEVERVLDRKIPAIPVLVRGASMPGAADLPATLAKLPRLNALALGEAQAEAGLRQLVDRLVRLLRRWQPLKIAGREQASPWDCAWLDVFWLSETEGWLCGAISEGGGGGDVGNGLLLATKDGGATWLKAANIASGAGRFTWGPRGTREYSWSEVGPVKALWFYGRRTGADDHTTGVIATATGVYVATAPYGRLDHESEWRRSSPPPDHPERYAFFAGIAGIEGLSELYACGWQGIAHWTARSGRWELPMPTYYYDITAVAAVGGSENRGVWAVGRAGEDERGNRGDRSHGAIYRLGWPANRWEQVPLAGVAFEEAQTFYDVCVPDQNTVFAVGDRGLIVRGVRERDREWRWTPLPAPASQGLRSITSSAYGLWIVGDAGTIWNSLDRGEHWTQLAAVAGAGGQGAGLARVRFFGETGWIVGQRVVLRSR